MTTPLVREITPSFMPLNAPTIPGSGPLRQSATPFQLKALAGSDFVSGAKVMEADEHAQMTAQAQKLVAQTFYGPMLKQMHNSPFKASWVDGGRGGEAFQPMLDQRLIDHLARTSGKKLVNTVVRKIERKKAYLKTSKSAKPASGKGNLSRMLGDPSLYNTGSHVAPGLRA